MNELATIDVVGFWIGIFLTFCILSFLYKDNPFYKLAEHLFIGVSIGYIVIRQFVDNIVPRLTSDDAPQLLGFKALWIQYLPVLLASLLFVKFVSRRLGWLGRFPLAFIVAMVAAQNVVGLVQSDVAEQIKAAGQPLDAHKVNLNTASREELARLPGATPAIVEKWLQAREQAPFTSVDEAVSSASLSQAEQETLADERGPLVGLDAKASVAAGEIDAFGTFSQVLLLIAFLTGLLYFYFSLAQKGVVGKVSRFGVWMLMIGFGASFGLTVQGRIALVIGRAQDIRGVYMDPVQAKQIHGEIAALVCIAIIVVGIVLWELSVRTRSKARASKGTAT